MAETPSTPPPQLLLNLLMTVPPPRVSFVWLLFATLQIFAPNSGTNFICQLLFSSWPTFPRQSTAIAGAPSP